MAYHCKRPPRNLNLNSSLSRPNKKIEKSSAEQANHKKDNNQDQNDIQKELNEIQQSKEMCDVVEHDSHNINQKQGSYKAKSKQQKMNFKILSLEKIFFCCLGKNTHKTKKYKAKSRIDKNNDQTNIKSDERKDFHCQYNVKSNHSLELQAYALTRSSSKLSSTSDQNLKQHLHRRNGHIHTFHILSNLKNNKKHKPIKFKRNNVVILKIPKPFDSKVSLIRTTNEKPLIIYDQPLKQPALNLNSFRKSSGKLCGPGEIFVKNNF